MLAAIVWGLLITAITEFLSLLNAITSAWVSGIWGVITIAALLLVLIFPEKRATSAHGLRLPNLSHSEILLLSTVALIVTLVGLIALIAPPNNWDSPLCQYK